MRRKITFRGMDYSDSIDKDIHEKVDKAEKFFKNDQGPIDFQAVVEANFVKNIFVVEFRLVSTTYNIIAQAEGHDIHRVVNEAGDTFMKELAREKEKLVEKQQHSKDH